MKYQKNSLAPLLFFMILSFFFCGSEDNSIKVKNWKILQYSTDSLVEASARTGWEPVEIPSSFKTLHPESGEFKSVWLKGEFNIDGDPSLYYGISTGRIKYSDAVYVNSLPVGSQHHKKISWSPSTRHYQIPAGVLRKGLNTIYIELGIYDKYHGGILDDVLIQPEEDFELTRFSGNLIYRQLPMGIVVLFAGLAITLLISFIWDRGEKIYIFSMFPLLVGIIYITVPFFPNNIISYEFCSRMQYSLAPVVSILFLMLSQSIYRIYLSHYNRVIIPLLLLFLMINLLTRGGNYDESIGFIIIILTVVTSVIFFIIMMYQIYRINSDRFLISFVSVIFFVGVFIMLFEAYQEKTGGRRGEMVATYAPITFIILGAIVSSREIKKRKTDLELVYDKLKKLEVKEVSITDNLEEKLKRIMAFIDENYTSDLSREGLAAAVGIHPNYFGRLFKTYTGRTINEYINNLRVGDAIEKLKMEDIKIIDIAFAVGFESLVTFNRVFKKIIGKTPSEYRDNT